MSSTTSTWEQASVAGPAAADPAKAMARTRLQSIDALRGFVMVVMLLDHVRENWFLYMQVSDPVRRAHNRSVAVLHAPHEHSLRTVFGVDSIVWVWVWYLALLVPLYFPTAWYSRLKARRRDIAWLKYF